MTQVSLFVSHSHEDNEWCRPLVAALKAVGYDVWYDETGLTGGASWVASIQREAQARDVFLLVLTPEAWASQWVQDELQLALATRRRILPVLLRNTQVDGFLLTTQWVTAIGEEPQVAARAIIMAIEAPPAPGRSAAPQAQTETLDDLVTLCQSLLAERRYTEALSACDRALALDPDNVTALRTQGAALSQIGQRSRAAAVFSHVLPLLDLASAKPTTVHDLCRYVQLNADDPEQVVATYRISQKRAELEGRPWDVRTDTDVIYRLIVTLGAIDTAVDLLSQYDKDGSVASAVIQKLARERRTDAMIQMGDRLGKDIEVTVELARHGPVDTAVRRAAQVQSMAWRRAIIDGFYWMASAFKEKNAAIDQVCRVWFGFPPPNRPYSSEYDGSLRIWSGALEQLGQHHDAAVVEKCVKRLR